jgi:hypothetical protein
MQLTLEVPVSCLLGFRIYFTMLTTILTIYYMLDIIHSAFIYYLRKSLKHYEIMRLAHFIVERTEALKGHVDFPRPHNE